MEPIIIVTSGKKYMDIDAYASCISYAKLLRKKGIQAKAVSYATLNESIPPKLFEMEYNLKKYTPKKEDKFIVLDVSNPQFFDTFVNEENVVQIIDHHPGYEKYWQEKLKENSIIEEVGAVATIIVEFYEKENALKEITKEEAYLLIAAILDNTLNFKAKITTKRDLEAYEKMMKIVDNDTDFVERYFRSCQTEIINNLEKNIKTATKNEKINDLLPKAICQLMVLDKEIILNKLSIIQKILDEIDEDWILNLICLKDGTSYIISKNPSSKKKIEELFNKKFNNDVLCLEELWLRKEIIKKAIR